MVVAALAMLAGFYVASPRLSRPWIFRRYLPSRRPRYSTTQRPRSCSPNCMGWRIATVLCRRRDPSGHARRHRRSRGRTLLRHSGVDFIAILRALWANVSHGEIVQGGSTITQQLIKNAFITDEQTLDRKFREAALAYQLEKQWSKEKILNEYLNIIYFGEGAYGIEAAAQSTSECTRRTSHWLKPRSSPGLPKAPSAYSPRRDPETAHVKDAISSSTRCTNNTILPASTAGGAGHPLQLAEKKDDDTVNVPYWVELVREQLVSRYGSSTVLGGGLRVYTSVDLACSGRPSRRWPTF